MVPIECYPVRIRATAHGGAAATYKVGAIIAQAAFTRLVTKCARVGHPHPWLNKSMQLFALFKLYVILTLLRIPKTKPKTSDELVGEGESNLTYGLRFAERFWLPTSAEIWE